MAFLNPRRILWNKRPDGTDGGDINEIVASNVDIHIEQMDARCWWIAIYTDASNHDAPIWTGNFTADRRGYMSFSEQDNINSFVWHVDTSYEDR